MPSTSPHDWLRPRLAALVAAAQAAGIARDVSVAVITDLINGPEFSAGAPAADENWNEDIGEPESIANVTLTPADIDVTDAMPKRSKLPDHIRKGGRQGSRHGR